MRLAPRLDFWSDVKEIGGLAIIGLQDFHQLPRIHTFRESNVLNPPRVCAPAVHRESVVKRSLRSYQRQSISQALFDVMFVDANLRSWNLRGFKPLHGRKHRQRQQRPRWAYFTDCIIRSHRIFDSPCCASFCLLNQMKEARPTM